MKERHHRHRQWMEMAWQGVRSHPALGWLSLFALLLLALPLGSGSYGPGIVLRSLAFVGIAALGESIVLHTGGIDLSIHAVYTFSGMCCTVLINQLGISTPLAILLGLAASAMLGWFNGAIITRFALPPYLVTIGTLGVYHGLCKVLSAKYPILYLPADFTILGQGQLLGIPIPFLVFLLLVGGYQLLMGKSVLSRWMFAVGSNAWAAQASGIQAARVQRIAYMLCSLLVGLSGILEAARIGFSWQSTESTLMLGVIAAAMTGIYEIRNPRWKVLGVQLGTVLIVGVEQCLALFQLLAWDDLCMGCAILAIIIIGRRKPAR